MTSSRPVLSAVLMIVGGMLGCGVAGSGFIDSPAARLFALVVTVVAIVLFVAGLALRGVDAEGPVS